MVTAPETCENGWHVSHAGIKHCDCGETRNTSYRNWWQRFRDRQAFKKLKRQQQRRYQ